MASTKICFVLPYPYNDIDYISHLPKDLVLKEFMVGLKNGLGNELNTLLRFIYQSIIHKIIN